MNWDSIKRKTGKFLFCILCLSLWAHQGGSVAIGARVAGDEGVTATTSEAQENTQKPVKVKPVTKPAPKKPVQRTEKAVQKKVITEDKKSPKKLTPAKPYVTIDFDNVDIAIFIKFISELTGKNFVIDKAVKGKVTIISPTKISVKEAYKVFESVLEVHGYTTVPAGRVIKIV
ncbi:MAG: hypothetical protein JSV50_19285, partial [Desulfobacteraceae bacterium]